MRDGLRAEIAARVLLTLGALLPYWRLLTFSVIFVTDDVFASDIFNGELPGRVLIGQLIRGGEWPVWTSQLCSGLALAGSPADPIGLAAFALLPPAAALDLFLIVLLLVAAHGSYGLARRFGADRPGAVLAGLAFAGSGYIAAQLKHLGIISTVVWLPVGLGLLDRVLAAGGEDDRHATPARRALFMASFGLVFAVQVLSGFPQSAYICGLVYGSFVLFRAIHDRAAFGLPGILTRLGGIGLATGLGAAAGAVVLLPLAALGSVSDRSQALGYDWATSPAYWPRNFLTFFVPYIHGDTSTNSYSGPSFFWEDFGYVGLATILLAIYGGLRERRRAREVFLILMSLVAYLLVLGRATPVFRLFYELLPGLSLFRAPTRFLIVVELGLAILGGIGLTRLGAHLRQRLAAGSRVPHVVVTALCVGTALDLFIHQPRHNPMVTARDWLAVPASVAAVRSDNPEPRTFTPEHRKLHHLAFRRAQGWTNLEPYFALRDVLEPNAGGGYWAMPSADCYAGIAPRWYIDVWGDHVHPTSLVSELAALDPETGALRVDPAFVRVMRSFGVTHVLSPSPQETPLLPLVRREGGAYVYRVDGAARVRFVRGARRVTSEDEANARLAAPDFDPNLEILLHDAPATVRPLVDQPPPGGAAPSAAGSAAVAREDQRHVVVDVDAPADGFLLLADTFFPGWSADVDGNPASVYRANISVRGVPVPQGRHTVTFRFNLPGFARGALVSGVAITTLLLWTVGAGYALLRRRRR